MSHPDYLQRPRGGENHPAAKLTRNEVILIKRRLREKEKHASIAADFPHVTLAQISSISSGRAWRSVSADDALTGNFMGTLS